LRVMGDAFVKIGGGKTSDEFVCDELNDRDDHVYILCYDILGATVRSEYIEMETG
jgi:hypothetical protein